MHLARITPYSERAREIVKRCGDNAILKADMGTRILVENEAGECWWLSNVEAHWIIHSNGGADVR